jgi:cytidyltransferase-like protein
MNAENKIKTFKELCQIVAQQKKKGRKVVQCHGVFDIIHPGIIRHIESAKRLGDVLIVTVIKDKDVRKGPGYPIFGEDLRVRNVVSIGCVDYVSCVDDSIPLQCVKFLKPDVFARGQDYKERDQETMRKIKQEEEAFNVAGCKIHYTPGEVFSSTNIINQFLDVYPEETRKYLREFQKKYTAQDIITQLGGLKKLKVLIIGDTIIDEYHYCAPLGKSVKEHLVVNKYLSDESFAGGVLAVANHVAGICDNVHLVTILGSQNPQKDFILKKLKENIKPKFFYRQDAATIVKRRFINQYLNQKLFEICYINDNEMPKKLVKQILDYLNKQIPKFDLIMVGDYGHSFITEESIKLIEKKAKVLAVNVQANGANLGFNMVTKYHNIDFACIDESEARLACQDRFGEINDIAKILAKCVHARCLIITRGKNGSIGVDGHGRLNSTPAFSSWVVDRIGAGDAYFSFAASCFAKGLPLELISFVGNAAGAIAVQIVCNREPVEPQKLFEFIYTLLR